jgi:hypothetical protein
MQENERDDTISAESIIDILDNECIEPSDVSKHVGAVVISIPMIYVNEKEDGEDECVQNLRIIKLEVLSKIMNIGINIAAASHDELVDIWENLMTILINSNKEKSNENEILQFLSFTTKIGRDMDIEDEYIDSMNSSCISFDVIRQYVNDPTTTLLVSANPRNWGNATFYSQLNDNQEVIMRARAECNDTDMNRFHYCMKMFEKTLKFESGFVYNKTVKLMNLALMYLCLINNSNPIKCMSSNDLKSNILGYMIDVVVRSRTIQAWLRSPSSKILMSDIAHNYNDKQIMVNLCKLKTAKDRAKYMLSQLAKNKNTVNIAKCLSYETYEEVLAKSCMSIQDSRYYVFDNKFILAIVSMNSFNALKNLYNESNKNSSNLDDL